MRAAFEKALIIRTASACKLCGLWLVALFVGGDERLIQRRGEVVGAADGAPRSQFEGGQEQFVAPEQDVEPPVFELQATPHSPRGPRT